MVDAGRAAVAVIAVVVLLLVYVSDDDPGDRTAGFIVGQLGNDDRWCLLDLFACPSG